MVSYKRLGSFVLADEIATDPFGRIHLALSLSGNSFEQHWMVRTFSEEWLEAGLGYQLGRASAAGQGLGPGFTLERGRNPAIVSEDIPGHSLAQALAKARQERVPFGLDQALSILRELAEVILNLHQAGASHGVLTPHSPWLSYGGTVHLLDAPYAPILKSLLPRVPQASAAIAGYLPPVAAAPVTLLQRDLYSLGAILFEMLTFQPLPESGVAAALAVGRLRAAQDTAPFPPSIQRLLERLLLVGTPFNYASEFRQGLESVLFNDDHAPSTFNTAFFLHTLFRAECKAGALVREASRTADFTPLTNADARPLTALQKPDYRMRLRWGILGGLVTASLLAGGVYLFQSKKRESERYQNQVSLLQRELAESQAAMADIRSLELSSQQREAELNREQAEAKSAQEKVRFQQLIDEEKRRAAEIAHQKEIILRSQEEMKTRSRAIAQSAQATPATQIPTFAAPPASLPAPQAIPAPANVAPATASPAAPIPPVITSLTPADPEVEIPPQILRQARPTMPRLQDRATLNWLRINNKDIHVLARVQVDQTGRAVKVLIPDSQARFAEFELASRKAALNSTFAPAQREGKPVSGWLTLEYDFKKPWMYQ